MWIFASAAQAATIAADIDVDTGEVIDTPEFLSATITSNPLQVGSSVAPGNPYLIYTRETFDSGSRGAPLKNWSIDGDVGTTFIRDPDIAPFDETLIVVIDFTVTHIVAPHAHVSTGDPFRFRFQFSTQDTPDEEVPFARAYRHDSALFAVPHKSGHSDNYLVDFDMVLSLERGAWALDRWTIQVKGEHDYIPPIPVPASGVLMLSALLIAFRVGRRQ